MKNKQKFILVVVNLAALMIIAFLFGSYIKHEVERNREAVPEKPPVTEISGETFDHNQETYDYICTTLKGPGGVRSNLLKLVDEGQEYNMVSSHWAEIVYLAVMENCPEMEFLAGEALNG